MVPSPHLWFSACKTAWFWTRISKSPWVQDLTCGFSMQNNYFMTRLTSLYGSQISTVVLSTHNSVLSTRINRLHWFQPSPVVLCMHNCVIMDQNYIVSMGPRPHLSFCAWKTTWFASELSSIYGSQTFICGFVHAIQRDFMHQNHKSL